MPNILATTIPMATDSRLTKLIPHGGLSQFGLGGPWGAGRVGGSMGYGGDIGSPPPAHPQEFLETGFGYWLLGMTHPPTLANPAGGGSARPGGRPAARPAARPQQAYFWNTMKFTPSLCVGG